jgi:hypothetical protein
VTAFPSPRFGRLDEFFSTRIGHAQGALYFSTGFILVALALLPSAAAILTPVAVFAAVRWFVLARMEVDANRRVWARAWKRERNRLHSRERAMSN